MKMLVTGAARSGKSSYAEHVACSLSQNRTYLATMRALGSEAHERIDHHRRQRAHLGFETIEQPYDVSQVQPSESAAQGVVLVEDLGNLVANNLFDDKGDMADADRLLEQLDADVAALADSFAHAVVVTNEIGNAGTLGSVEGDAYLRLLGALACRVAQRCDSVVEVVSGVPCALKGSLR